MRNILPLLFLGGFYLLTLLSCDTSNKSGLQEKFVSDKKTTSPMSNSIFPYDLTAPVLDAKLPKTLKEISGICMATEKSLYAIQDEDGILFEISLLDGEVVASYPFGIDNDYEGIAFVDNTIYILSARGTIFRLQDWEKTPIVDSFETPLSVENDTEGLCYEPHTHSLLIACKAKSLGNSAQSTRSIYRFSLESMQLDTKPAFELQRETLYQFLSKQNAEEIGMTKLLRKLIESEDELFLGPSDIAIHPITQQLYIPASRGNCMLVLSPKGELVHCVYLSPDQFRQPEGICFDANASLYLSSEGAGKKARLFRFEPK